MSESVKTALIGLAAVVILAGAYLFATVHDEVKIEMVKAVPIVVGAALSGAAAVLTAIGYMQNRKLLAGHQQLNRNQAELTRTVRDEADKIDSTVKSTGAKVAVVTVKKAQETQEKVEQVHQLVNGGPDGIGALLKRIMVDAMKEAVAQATERVASSTERGQAKEAREYVSGKKETDQAMPTVAHTQLVEDLKDMKESSK